MQGKSRTLSLTPEKERLQDLTVKEDQVGLLITKLGRKSKHVLQNYVIRLQHFFFKTPACLIQLLPPVKLTNLQRRMIAKMAWTALPSHLSPMFFCC